MQPADGALAAKRWGAVGVADATHAMIGGAGGELVSSTTANAIPDTTAPTGTISGPDTATVGTADSYTAVLADNTGGSGVDSSSLSWTATGLPGTPATRSTTRSATPGTYLISLAFKDLAGNTATISKSVTVKANGGADNAPQHTTTVTDQSGAKVTLSTPKRCVPRAQRSRSRCRSRRSRRRARPSSRCSRSTSTSASKIVVHDKKAPFAQRLKVKVGTKSGSKVTVRARAFMKVRHPKRGKFPTKSIRATVTVC